MGAGRLQDKVAIVTGGGQGIGRGIVRVFAAAGAKVLVATRTEKHGRAAVEEATKAGGVAKLCVADVGSVEECNRIVAETIAAFGRVDVLVHNAASFLGGPVEGYSEADLETVLAVNLKACFRLSAACIPHFRKQKWGRLLFTSSVTGPRVAMPGTSYYAASKGGVNAFIRTAAMELAREGITVNGVEPGFIAKPGRGTMSKPEVADRLGRFIPMGRLGEADDIAYAMLYLASEQAKYVTGQTIVVDGGSTLPETGYAVERHWGLA